MHKQKAPLEVPVGLLSLTELALPWVTVGVLGCRQDVLPWVAVGVLRRRQNGLAGAGGMLAEQAFHITEQIAGVESPSLLILLRGVV